MGRKRAYRPPVAMSATFYGTLFASCRKNAVKRNIPFTLTREDLNALVVRAGGRCQVSGVTFSDELPPGATRRPYIASLDRIDPTGGYTPDNVRLVCALVNYAMMDWGVGPLRHVAQSLMEGPRVSLLEGEDENLAKLRAAAENPNHGHEWLTLREWWERIGWTGTPPTYSGRLSAALRTELKRRGLAPRRKAHLNRRRVSGTKVYGSALSFPAYLIAEQCRML